MGPSFSRKSQNPSLKPAHNRIPEPAESVFDQDFDQFMNSLDNFDPFDDLEDWSNNVDLFMDAWQIHPSMLTPFGNWPNSKKEKPKLQNNPANQSLTNPRLRSLKD